MAFTIADVITRAKNRLGITDTSQDDRLLEWCDDARDEINIALAVIGQNWRSTKVDINIIKDTDTYTPTDIYFCIQAVHYKEGDVYVPLDYNPEIIRFEYNTGSPARGVSAWCFKGNSILLNGMPSDNVTAGLRLLVFPSPDDYESEDEVSDLVNAMRLLYVMYLCKTYTEAQDPKTPNLYSEKFNSLLEQYVAVAQRRYSGQQVLQNYMDD
jgi:hypothetical protein